MLKKHKLSVFISSAMGAENETVWIDIRKRISETLDSSGIIETFVIENHTSDLPSEQLFFSRVNQADIIVVLVQGDVRVGTRKEIEFVLENNKPFLTYFCKSDIVSESVVELKSLLIEKDRNTFKDIENFDKIDEIVREDVLTNLIFSYQNKHKPAFPEQEMTNVLVEKVFEDNIISKRALDYFNCNIDFFLEKFSLGNEEVSLKELDDNKIGIQLINWIYSGESFPDMLEIEKIIQSMSLDETLKKILELRHQSVIAYFKNDLSEALKKLEKASEISSQKGTFGWLKNDILLDSRNIQFQLDMKNKKFQNDIKESDSFAYFPLGDKFLKESYELLERDRFIMRTLSRGETRLDNEFKSALQSLENYLYSSYLIGSSTRTLMARRKVAELLLEYSEIYEENSLKFEAIRLMILTGDSKTFEKTLLSCWDKISNYFAVEVNSLWQLTEKRYCNNNISMKCFIMKSLGQYMSGSTFRAAESFLHNYSKEIESPEKAKLVVITILRNIDRINSHYALDMVLNVLKSKKLTLFDQFTELLSIIKIDECEKTDVEFLLSMLMEEIDKLLSRNGAPYFIINLLDQSNLFRPLYNKLKKIVPRETLDILSLEIEGADKAVQILQSSIYQLNARFKESVKGIQSIYVDNPLHTILQIVRKHSSERVFTSINTEFLNWVPDLLASDNIGLSVKQSYLFMLLQLIIEYLKLKKQLPEEIIEFLLNSEIKLYDEYSLIDSLTKASRISSQYYLHMIWILLRKESQEEELFSLCIGYKENKVDERKAFSDTIVYYLEYCYYNRKTVPLIVSLVIFEMSRDDFFLVRKNAIKGLLYSHAIIPSEISKRELIRMTLDESPNVKCSYANYLGEIAINDKDSKELLEMLKRDASFNVTYQAQTMELNLF